MLIPIAAKDSLIEAVGALIQSIAAKESEYNRLREQVTDTTLAFRKLAEAIDDQPRFWQRILGRHPCKLRREPRRPSKQLARSLI